MPVSHPLKLAIEALPYIRGGNPAKRGTHGDYLRATSYERC